MKGSGRHPAPAEWVISRICEDFHCLPSEARRELRRAPGLLSDVMEMRSYARTREALLAAKSESDVPRGQLADWVCDHEVELMRERGTDHDD